MLPLQEIDIMGVFVTPFALCLPVAVALCRVVVRLMGCIPALAAVSRSPLLELGVFTGLLSIFILMLGRI